MKKLQEVRDARAYNSPEEVDYAIIPQGSIACVTGFKVNMVNKTITATSPCYTSQNGATDIENMGQSVHWARDCSSRFGKTHFNGNVTLSQHRDEICMAR